MPIINSFTAYGIQIEWLLTWFPIQANSAIDAQRTRAGRISYNSTDEPFASVNAALVLLGQGPQAPSTFGDPLSTNNVAGGFKLSDSIRRNCLLLLLKLDWAKRGKSGRCLLPQTPYCLS